MPLQQDAIYITPDGRKFRASVDRRLYGEHRSWTLVPIANGEALSRDALEQMLFVHWGRVVRLDFEMATLVVDTGWTEAELRREEGESQYRLVGTRRH